MSNASRLEVQALGLICNVHLQNSVSGSVKMRSLFRRAVSTMLWKIELKKAPISVINLATIKKFTIISLHGDHSCAYGDLVNSKVLHVFFLTFEM